MKQDLSFSFMGVCDACYIGGGTIWSAYSQLLTDQLDQIRSDVPCRIPVHELLLHIFRGVGRSSNFVGCKPKRMFLPGFGIRIVQILYNMSARQIRAYRR